MKPLVERPVALYRTLLRTARQLPPVEAQEEFAKIKASWRAARQLSDETSKREFMTSECFD